jgi:hypothetical protein
MKVKTTDWYSVAENIAWIVLAAIAVYSLGLIG